MKLTQGFSFIELMVGLLITSILSIALYQIFRQTQRSTKSIQSMMDYTVEIPVVYNQLEKDIAALFVPERFFKQREAQEKKSAKQPAQKKEKKKIKQIPHVFYLQKSGQNLEMLSFISTHSLSLYNSAVPHNVRIAYKLVPIPGEGEKRYRLVRQEITDIAVDLKEFSGEKIRGYDLMTQVKSLAVELYAPEKLPKIAKKPDAKQEKQKRQYKQFVRWVSDEIKDKTEYPVPAFVVIKGVFVDQKTSRERSFEWRFEVMSFDAIEQRLQDIKAPKKKPKKEQKKSPAPQRQQPTKKKSPMELKGDIQVTGPQSGRIVS